MTVQVKSYWADGKAHILLREGDQGEHWEFGRSNLEVLRWVFGLDRARFEIVGQALENLMTKGNAMHDEDEVSEPITPIHFGLREVPRVTDTDLRAIALEEAVKLAGYSQRTDGKLVVTMAEQFYVFLKGNTIGAVQ